MTRNPEIPPSPSDADYLAHDAALPDLGGEDEPLALFTQWFAAAKSAEPNDPNAMCLATVDADGMPDARMVLLKDFNVEGLTFYTNLESAKGQQLSHTHKAALVFHWKSLRRQVRWRGVIAPVSDVEADAYFASRARDSQIGAWASAQSRPLEGRFALEAEIAKQALRFGVGPIPRPPHWSGFRLIPLQVEFWRDRAFRLHDRVQFTRAAAGDAWQKTKLYP
jgi:pyridoxamine 5'-phosphate oxidase